MMEAESRDHRGYRWSTGSRVICSGTPPRNRRTQSWRMPPLSEMNATDLPSGEMAGNCCKPTKSVSRSERTTLLTFGLGVRESIHASVARISSTAIEPQSAILFHLLEAGTGAARSADSETVETDCSAKARSFAD